MRRRDGEAGGAGTGRRPPLTIIFAITMTGILVNTLVSPVIPDILDDLQANRNLAGLLLAAATMPGILLAPAAGILADRFGRREVIVPSLVLFGLGGLAGGLAPNFWFLIGMRLVQGAGSAGLINLAIVVIGDHWDGADRARVIGRNAAVLTVSLALLPPLGGFLAELGSWRTPFFVYPVALVTAWGVLRRLERQPTRDVRFREQLNEAAPYLTSPTTVGVLGAGVILFVLIFGLVLTVFPLFLESRFGLGPSMRGVMLGLPAVTSTTGALLMGRLNERFGRRGPLIASAALFPVAYAIIGPAPHLWIVVVGILVMGAGEGVLIPTLQDIAAGVAPRSSRGTVVAVWVGAARLGQTIGPVVAGVALGALGATATFGAGAAVAVTMPAILAFVLRGGRVRALEGEPTRVAEPPS
ncbi:MAG: MFS transporter [Nitriliruptorales bacterium]